MAGKSNLTPYYQFEFEHAPFFCLITAITASYSRLLLDWVSIWMKSWANLPEYSPVNFQRSPVMRQPFD